MRIRSSLTEDSLYGEAKRRAGQRGRAGGMLFGGRATPGRRVLRLVVLLVLVLLLMREAADPQVYRNFFAALGAPLKPTPQAEPTRVVGGEVVAGQVVPEIGPVDAEDSAENSVGASAVVDRAVVDWEAVDWEAVVRELDATSLEALVGWLHETRSDSAVASRAESLAVIEPNLSSAAVNAGVLDGGELEAGELSRWLRAPESRPQWLAGLRRAVDTALLADVSDATIWQSGDRLAFYRLLAAGASEGAGAGEGFASFGDQVIRVGYTTLADQAPVYRGKPVWLEGQVARVERTEAVENPFGIEAYYLVWLRPDDGSQRPVMAYALELPSEVLALQGETLVEDGPAVRAVGVFLRRHLYRSQRGSELAPVIVGRVELLEATEVPQESIAATQSSAAGGVSWGWMLSVTAVCGVALAGMVAWYTAQAGRWQRAMRRRGMPAEFPGGLEWTGTESSGVDEHDPGATDVGEAAERGSEAGQ